MVAIKRVPVVEIQCEVSFTFTGRSVPLALVAKSEDTSEEPRGSLLVVGRHDSVVQEIGIELLLFAMAFLVQLVG